jgi:hypothetical protein
VHKFARLYVEVGSELSRVYLHLFDFPIELLAVNVAIIFRSSRFFAQQSRYDGMYLKNWQIWKSLLYGWSSFAASERYFILSLQACIEAL